MTIILGWFLLLLGIIVLSGTLGVYRLLVARRSMGRAVYLTRGLLLGGGMVLLWLALVVRAGAWAAWLGILAEIAAALLTVAAIRHR